MDNKILKTKSLAKLGTNSYERGLMGMAPSCCGSANAATRIPSKISENEEVKVAHVYIYTGREARVVLDSVGAINSNAVLAGYGQQQLQLSNEAVLQLRSSGSVEVYCAPNLRHENICRTF